MATGTELDVREARARAGRIRAGIHNYLATLAEIAEAYAARDWVALGYADWQSYVDEEYGAERLRLPAEHRQKAVAELRLAGMSTRAIAVAVGVSQPTVVADLSAGDQNLSAGPQAVTGVDGKTYAAARPDPTHPDDEPLPLGEPALEGTVVPPPQPAEPRRSNRKPLPDVARTAGWELNRAVEQVSRIAQDDRFAANAAQVATHLRHHLLRSIETLSEVLDRLPNPKENGTR